MATFGDVVNRICDDFDEPSAEIGELVKREIKSAIEFYQSKRFWFNTEIVPLVLTPTRLYALADFSPLYPIPLSIESIEVTSPTQFSLDSVTYNFMKDYEATIDSGVPDYFCVYNKTLFIYPTPDQNYNSLVSGTVQYADLIGDSDTNPWLVEGEQLIRTHAMMVVARRKFRDDAFADSLALEINGSMGAGIPGILSALQDRTSSEESTGMIREWD